MRDGFRFIGQRPFLWSVILQFFFVNAALVGSLSVLGPLVADASFSRQAWGVAFFLQMSGLAVGSVLAAPLRVHHGLRFGVLCTFVLALGPFRLGFDVNLVLVAAALFLVGVALEQFGVAWDVSLQENVPEDKLGRVYSVDALGGFAAIPLGEFWPARCRNATARRCAWWARA
jgi:hypothetical protein